MLPQPGMCRPEAFYCFAEQLPVIDTTAGLLTAAVAISMHVLDDVDPLSVELRLHSLADRVTERVRNPSPPALLAHLHQVLFEEEGFRGNSTHYYDPANSYLPSVLKTGRGIPISLCLIYKVVAEQVGLQAHGVNTPGHFLARVATEDGWMTVDPFFSGGILNDAETFQRVEQVTGRPVPRNRQYLEAATHSQWLSRMLVNLQHIFATADRRQDLAAMSELQSLLDYSLY